MNFTSPLVSRLLASYGFKENYYYWRALQGSNNAELCCRKLFDPAGVYEVSEPVIISTGNYEIIPAFSIAQLDMQLPDWYCERKNGTYNVFCDELYKLEPTSAGRLADALGLMVINALKARVVKLYEDKKPSP